MIDGGCLHACVRTVLQGNPGQQGPDPACAHIIILDLNTCNVCHTQTYPQRQPNFHLLPSGFGSGSCCKQGCSWPLHALTSSQLSFRLVQHAWWPRKRELDVDFVCDRFRLLWACSRGHHLSMERLKAPFSSLGSFGKQEGLAVRSSHSLQSSVFLNILHAPSDLLTCPSTGSDSREEGEAAGASSPRWAGERNHPSAKVCSAAIQDVLTTLLLCVQGAR